MAALIEEFNDLCGSTIQEHKKNFSFYVNKLKTLDDTERLNILNNLRAEHRQEEIFLTSLLLKFNQKTKIKELVLQGDRHLNRIVANHKPFVFRDEPISYFVNELFPNVSYVVRTSCLNKMAKIINRDDVGEEFFKQVLERYGINTAQIMLPVCNEAFIKEVLTQNRVVLRERQLITLHQRFGAEFLEFYYIECCKYGMSNHFAQQACFARYLSTKDITTFCQLLKYGKPKIGRKGFLNFLGVNKDDLLKEPTKYSTFIKLDILYRELTKDEYRMYLLNTLPKSVVDFNVFDIPCLPDLKLLPIKYRGITLESIFKEKYGCEFHSKYSSPGKQHHNVMELKDMLALEDMQKFHLSDDDMLEYLPPSKAFPLIKERINLTSDITNRTELLMRLFRCAKNNNDEAALVEALKYLNHRHKNEQSSIREDVFNYMRQKYKMETLSADIWECLHEIILTEMMLTHHFTLRDMLQDEMHYKFINGMDFTPEFRKWVKQVGPYYYSLTSENKDLNKWMLLHLPEYCKELFSTEDGQKTWPRGFLSLLQSWNGDNPKDQISFFKYPDVIDLCLKHDESFEYDNLFGTSIVVFPPQDEKERELRDGLIENHFDKMAHCSNFWPWLLKNRVEVVEKQIDLFFKKIYSPNHVRWFMSELNKMHYTSLPATVRAKALKLVNESVDSIEKKEEDNPVTSSQRQLALHMLSYQKDFMQIIDNDRFYPSGEAEVDVFDESFKETFNLREQVVECLKNRPCSQEVMSMLLRFCFKDYKAAVSVLNNVLYNLPEKDLVQPLQILQGRSLSVRKRALSLATTLGTAQTSCDALQYAGENKKNKSLLKFVFNRTFKNFRFVGNQRSWELLMSHFTFVFENDLETCNMVLQFKLIPLSYLPQYVEKVWNHIGKSGENHHNTVMNALNPETMAMLTDELCDDIIHYTLTNSKDQMSKSDVDFIYSYLLSSVEKIDHRFDLVASNARIVADENSQLDFKEFNKKSSNISFLYNDLCERLMTNDEAAESAIHRTEKKMLLNKLAEAFPNLPLPYNRLDYQLQIEVCRCYLDDVALIPGLIIKMQKDVLYEHGEMMMDYFNEFAASQVNLLVEDDEDRLMFVQKLLEADNSSSIKLLAIRLMPREYPISEACALHFRKLLEKIEADSAPIVSLYLNRFLKNLYLNI